MQSHPNSVVGGESKKTNGFYCTIYAFRSFKLSPKCIDVHNRKWKENTARR